MLDNRRRGYSRVAPRKIMPTQRTYTAYSAAQSAGYKRARERFHHRLCLSLSAFFTRPSYLDSSAYLSLFALFT